jgi:8-oxo-dGTP diphosphatase
MTNFCYDYPRPAVTTDICLFTLQDEKLAILLIKRRETPFLGHWALPGGFIRETETLDECAARKLTEETGLYSVPLETVGTFSDPSRDPRGRVITFAYFGLLPHDQQALIPGNKEDAVQWHCIDQLPSLAFDHAAIVSAARKKLIDSSERSPIVLALMPQHFTLSQLQKVYETVEDKELDKRNFRRSILEKGWLKETGQYERGPNRPAMIFGAANSAHHGLPFEGEPSEKK